MIYGLISCILRYVLYNTCVLLGSNGIKSILQKQLTFRKLCLFRLDLKSNSEQLDKTDYQSSTYSHPHQFLKAHLVVFLIQFNSELSREP